MNRIDKIIGNVLGKNKTKKKGLGLNLNMKPMNLGLSKKPIGASIRLQNQWKSFSPMKKVALQKRFKDSDRDGVPDRWDCQPMNPRRQEKVRDKNYICLNGKKISQASREELEQAYIDLEIETTHEETRDEQFDEIINEAKSMTTRQLKNYIEYNGLYYSDF